MKKIKIARIIARLNIGGPALQAILLTEGLDKTRFDSLLICGSTSKDEGDMLYYAAQKNIKPHFIPELKRELSLINDIIAFKKIYQIIKREQPDIIHTHTAKAGTLGRLVGILYKFSFAHNKATKLIHTFHGHVFEGYFNKIKTKIFIFIEWFLAGFTSIIITVSDSVKEELISFGICGSGKIKIIPLGLELDKFLKIPERNEAVLNIGIVGRLVPIKNHRLFLEAAAGVLKDSPQMKLRFKIIGDGELREELKGHTRKLGIDAQVDFLGWRRDLAEVYSDLDIVTLTSMNEGTPVSLIEAMASARAIVATDVGGVRDLLGTQIHLNVALNADFKILEKGVMVKPQDPHSFASALNFILRNEDLRKKIGVSGREFVRDKFSKERLIKDIEGLYEGVVE